MVAFALLAVDTVGPNALVEVLFVDVSPTIGKLSTLIVDSLAGIVGICIAGFSGVGTAAAVEADALGLALVVWLVAGELTVADNLGFITGDALVFVVVPLAAVEASASKEFRLELVFEAIVFAVISVSRANAVACFLNIDVLAAAPFPRKTLGSFGLAPEVTTEAEVGLTGGHGGGSGGEDDDRSGDDLHCLIGVVFG